MESMEGLTLKQLRLIQSKSMFYMAALLKIHPQTYSKIERCPEKATIEQARIISNDLKIPIDIIFLTEKSKKLRI